jgi:hypothetical protein
VYCGGFLTRIHALSQKNPANSVFSALLTEGGTKFFELTTA